MSSTHRALVLIPSYNSGRRLTLTVREALEQCSREIWVVIDGSTDGSDAQLQDELGNEPRLRILRQEKNGGKGSAVRRGARAAFAEGFTHALVMDADGQHPAGDIERFCEASRRAPEAMVLGQPIFDKSVPLERLHGRKLSVWLVRAEIWSRDIGDPLYGFRVYPIGPLLEAMRAPSRSNRYEFDPEVAVRLHWNGVPTVKLDAPVRYLSKEEGGVSHFNYIRDNARYVCLHSRLLAEAPWRIALRAAAQRPRAARVQ